MNRFTFTQCAMAALFSVVLSACDSPGSRARAVYLLIDTSGTYTAEMEKAQAIINYLLAELNSGDSIAVARIDSGSFSEKDIIAKVSFNERPSMATAQKRAFQERVNEFVSGIERGSRHTDITGGIIQAREFLAETGAGEQFILIFSDLEEDLTRGHIRDFPVDLSDINVIALNVTKLRSDNIDPRDYLTRLDDWQARVDEGGGSWKVLNDLERMDRIIAQR